MITLMITLMITPVGLEHMTTVEEFKQNVIASLDFLDTKLPSGSHVLFVALADGRILYDTTHNETHPVLAPYPDVYVLLEGY